MTERTRRSARRSRKERGEATLQDVAQLAGVSPATVSRVLNGNASVGGPYRDRVRAAIEQVNYRPNRLARNLRRRRSGVVALVVPDITNAHFAEMVDVIEGAVHADGLGVLVCTTDEQPSKQARYLSMLLEERVSAVVISPSDPAGGEIGRLIDEGIPVVAVDRAVADRRADAVIADNVAATRAATELLIEAGRREIVLVSGRRQVETGAERLRGFELAMRARGLQPRAIDGDFRFEDARRAISALLVSRAPLDALVAANNLMALGALKALREHGVAVPGEVALVGIDDPPWAQLLDPPLTVVAQPVAAMAADALRLLDERAASPTQPARRIVHPFELRVRASCASAQALDGRRA